MPANWVNWAGTAADSTISASDYAYNTMDYDGAHSNCRPTVDGDREKKLRKFMKGKTNSEIKRIIDFIERNYHNDGVWNFIIGWKKCQISGFLEIYDFLRQHEKEQEEAKAFLKELMVMNDKNNKYRFKKLMLEWFRIYELKDSDEELVERRLNFKE